MKDCLVSFGSNLGDSRKTVSAALDELKSLVSQPGSQPGTFQRSDFFATRPIGGPSNQHEFINGVVRFQSSLEPRQLLEILHAVEKKYGRQRRVRWDARTLDLDLLLHGSTILIEDDFQVPHPRMCFRQFVLQPAVQIASDILHPICGVTIGNLLNCISSRQEEVLLLTSPARVVSLDPMIRKNGWSSCVNVQEWKKFSFEKTQTSKYKLMAIDTSVVEINDLLTERKEILAWQDGPVVLINHSRDDNILVELAAAIETMKEI